MPSDPRPPNALLPLGEVRSTRAGDLPEPVRRRYFVEDRGREWRLFVDAQSKSAVIEDRGRRLLSRRSDPNAVRDMTAIAVHRGWRAVDVRGARTFRREAWIAGRAAGLEVRGYRPTERDLQALERRTARDQTRSQDATPPPRPSEPRRDGASDRLRIVEAVVRHRIADPSLQARQLSNARERIAGWLERGARFEPIRPPHDATRGHDTKERRRAR
jgi:hypothetical protein